MGKLNIPDEQMDPATQQKIHEMHERWREDMHTQQIEPGHAIAAVAHFLCLGVLSVCETEQQAHQLLNVMLAGSHTFVNDNWKLAQEYMRNTRGNPQFVPRTKWEA